MKTNGNSKVYNLAKTNLDEYSKKIILYLKEPALPQIDTRTIIRIKTVSPNTINLVRLPISLG
jgi:hypothetical protein